MFLASFTRVNALQLIFYLAVLVGILFITYYVTKWIAGYQKSQNFNRNFEIIETVKITTGKFLQIVRVGKDEYYVISIGKDEIHFLGKLEKDQIIFEQTTEPRKGFAEILSKFKDKGDKDED